ncbi:MAG: hypothetical protein L0H25_10230 [Micrococcales bacterium]|nr:hypothetical protein [Micrococcales bacterium]
MSDLQCAARFVVLEAQTLGELPGLVDRLAGERIAALYAAHDVAGDGAVTWLAGELGLGVEVTPGDLTPGGAGYDELADRHRGETVVVVQAGAASAPTLLLVDADGWSTEEF